MGCGDWELGFGDWGLGIGPNPQSPIPNPQSPIPLFIFKYIYFVNLFLNYKLIINQKIFNKSELKINSLKIKLGIADETLFYSIGVRSTTMPD